ncbi:MAG: hypothetical protein GEU81_06185 [Nitriliruptorales bacterium]|nr:hypothetical protein [Nitriliruptorales bacterium]
MATGFLVHAAEDSVGVAITDLSSSERVEGIYQHGGSHPAIEVSDTVPLGHKIALADIPAGQRVVKYGTAIGVATRDIHAGQHVHTHNLRGERW